MGIDDLQDNWEAFGRTIPMRSILWRTEPWQSESFFATGRGGIGHSMAQLAELGIRPTGRALDFGCGIGRLTQALAEYFDEVVGVDVAASMIDLARERNQFEDRCRYVVNAREDLSLFDDASFDFIYSQIVLQHVGPDLAKRYIREFIRILRPTGVAMFQLPSSFVPPAPLPASGFLAQIEMVSAEPRPGGPPLRIEGGSRFSMLLRIANRSPEGWLPAQRLAIGAHWRLEGGESAEDGNRTALGENLDKQESVEVEAEATAPLEPGHYVLEFDILQEGVAWFGDRGSPTLCLPMEVIDPSRSGPRTAAPHEVRQGPSEFAPHMEMHAVGRSEVVELLQSHGAEVLAVLDDDSAGSEWLSYFYVARKLPNSAAQPRKAHRLHRALRRLGRE